MVISVDGLRGLSSFEAIRLFACKILAMLVIEIGHYGLVLLLLLFNTIEIDWVTHFLQTVGDAVVFAVVDDLFVVVSMQPFSDLLHGTVDTLMLGLSSAVYGVNVLFNLIILETRMYAAEIVIVLNSIVLLMAYFCSHISFLVCVFKSMYMFSILNVIFLLVLVLFNGLFKHAKALLSLHLGLSSGLYRCNTRSRT